MNQRSNGGLENGARPGPTAGQAPAGPHAGADPAPTPESPEEAASRAAMEMQDRRRQLSYLQELLRNPEILELRDAPITTSTTDSEIEQYKTDVRYRIRVLEALLTISREELTALENLKIKRAPDSEAAGAMPAPGDADQR